MAAGMLSRVIIDPLRGNTLLWKVYWIYGTVIAVTCNLLLLAIPPDTVAVRVYMLACLVVATYWAVSIWRCALNCQSRALGYFVRAAAAVSLLVVPVAAYVILTGDLSGRHLTTRWSGP
jgi:hypothetical protein